MPSQTVTLVNPTGLHARPAKVFAQAAGKTGLTVKVTKGDNTVNARSVLSVLTLDCHYGDEITVTVESDDEATADAVLAQLVELVETGLGEDLGASRP